MKLFTKATWSVVFLIIAAATAGSAQGGLDRPRPHLNLGYDFNGDGAADLAFASAAGEWRIFLMRDAEPIGSYETRTLVGYPFAGYLDRDHSSKAMPASIGAKAAALTTAYEVTEEGDYQAIGALTGVVSPATADVPVMAALASRQQFLLFFHGEETPAAWHRADDPDPMFHFGNGAGWPYAFDADGDGNDDLVVISASFPADPRSSKATIPEPPAPNGWLYQVDLHPWDGEADLEVAFGSADQIPLFGDLDGDRTIDLVTYERQTGTWRIATGRNGTVSCEIATPPVLDDSFQDAYRACPVARLTDFDGDRRSDLAVLSPGDQEGERKLTVYFDPLGSGDDVVSECTPAREKTVVLQVPDGYCPVLPGGGLPGEHGGPPTWMTDPPMPNLAAGPTDWDGDGRGDIAFLLRKLSDDKTYLVIDNKLEQRMSRENGVGRIEIAVPLNNRQSFPAQYKITAGPLLSPHQTALLVQHKGWDRGQYQVITAREAGPLFNFRQVYKWGNECKKKKAPFNDKSAMFVAHFGENRIVNWVDNQRYIRTKPIPGRVVWNGAPGFCTGVEDPPGFWNEPRGSAAWMGYYDGVDKGAGLVKMIGYTYHGWQWHFNVNRNTKTDKWIKFKSLNWIPGDFNGDRVSDVAVYWPVAPGEYHISTKSVMDGDVENGDNLWNKFPASQLYVRSGGGASMAADFDLDGTTELAVWHVDRNAKLIKVKIDFDDDHDFEPEEVYKLSYQGYYPIGSAADAGNFRVPLPNRSD